MSDSGRGFLDDANVYEEGESRASMLEGVYMYQVHESRFIQLGG